MENIINEVYENSNLPSAGRLYKLIKDQYPENKITMKNIKDFLETKVEKQIYKETKKKSVKKQRKIFATFKNEKWQMDIFVFDNYAKQNNGYKYMLACIDVFSRQAYVQPMKTNNTLDCISAFKLILKKDVPFSILSDHDSSFLSKDFQKLISDNNIAYNVNTLNDHKALSIIDRFAKTLKKILVEKMKKNKNLKWLDILENTINDYNKMPHSSLYNTAPKDVNKKPNIQKIYNLNIEKAKTNVVESDLVIGNKVRIRISGLFSKASDQQFSDEIYIVKKVNFGNISLDDNQTYKRTQLLKVPDSTVATDKPNLMMNAKKSKKVSQILKADGIDASNVVKSKANISKILADSGIDKNNIIDGKRSRKKIQ